MKQVRTITLTESQKIDLYQQDLQPLREQYEKQLQDAKTNFDNVIAKIQSEFKRETQALLMRNTAEIIITPFRKSTKKKTRRRILWTSAMDQILCQGHSVTTIRAILSTRFNESVSLSSIMYRKKILRQQ